MEDDHKLREVTVRGIVLPTEWNRGGQVLRVAILTPDEDQYDVSDTGEGRRLLHALREEIEARVRIDQAQGNRQCVTVLSFTVLDECDAGYILEDLLKEPEREGC